MALPRPLEERSAAVPMRKRNLILFVALIVIALGILVGIMIYVRLRQ